EGRHPDEVPGVEGRAHPQHRGPLLPDPRAGCDRGRIPQVHASGLHRAVEQIRGPVPLPLPRLALRQAHRRRHRWTSAARSRPLPHRRRERFARRGHEPAQRPEAAEQPVGPGAGRGPGRVVDINIILAAASLLLFVALLAYFGFVAYHQQQIEPDEKPATGVELLRQHYGPGDTVEQPTPYWVAPTPAAPDPLEISGNLDRKIVAGGVMLFALFGLVGGYLLLEIIPSGPLSLRAAAADKQIETSIQRGKNLYANFCYPCHGKLGLGNGENDVNGKPLPGKPLNVAANKYDTLKED